MFYALHSKFRIMIKKDMFLTGKRLHRGHRVSGRDSGAPAEDQHLCVRPQDLQVQKQTVFKCP